MRNLVSSIRQSPPIDLQAPFDPAGVAGKTILVTGGAGGIGAGFAREWAAHGAHMIIGDLNDEAGEELVAELRKTTGSAHHHYFRCDVSDWQSQVSLFQNAARCSPHGGIDAVVANAAINDLGFEFQEPTTDLTQPNPPPPNLKCLEVNITGVAYTAHLALFWLPRNPGSSNTPGKAAENGNRDRHLLLLGSVASMIPFAIQPQYTTSKHAVMGLFRALRGSAWKYGVRVNIVCPYFIKTPIIIPVARVFLAGSGMGSVEAVVDAGTRLMADGSIVGRGLVAGPKVKLKDNAGKDDEFEVVSVEEDSPTDDQDGPLTSVWECYAHDYEDVEVFVWRYVRMLNQVERIRGWTGWCKDIVGAIAMGIRGSRR